MAAYHRVYDMTHVTCRLTAKNCDQLRNPTLGSRVLDTFFSLPFRSNITAASAVIPILCFLLICQLSVPDCIQLECASHRLL